MKTKPEIQKAHDMLAGILLGDVPNPFGECLPDELKGAADVLCWVLQHDHNDSFARNLQQIEQRLAADGFILRGLEETLH